MLKMKRKNFEETNKNRKKLEQKTMCEIKSLRKEAEKRKIVWEKI